MTGMELIKRYNSGQRDFRCVDLRGVDLRGVDLTDVNLSYANLEGADLYNANLTDVNLSYTNLEGAKLNGADLRFTYLRNAKLKHMIIRGSMDTAIATKDQIQIGCEIHSIEYWIENYKKIGVANKYSAEQIDEYEKIIKMIKTWNKEVRSLND
jgi:hypothetical protein